jgi:hypothetical protein
MQNDVEVLEKKTEKKYPGLNVDLYRADTLQIALKTQAQSKMWSYFGRQVSSFLDFKDVRKKFIVCTLCGMYMSYHGTASLKQHLGSHRSHPGVMDALADNRDEHEKARTDADAFLDDWNNMPHQLRKDSMMPAEKQNMVNSKLLEWLIAHFQPLHLVENPLFRDFARVLNNGWSVPCSKTVVVAVVVVAVVVAAGKLRMRSP